MAKTKASKAQIHEMHLRERKTRTSSRVTPKGPKPAVHASSPPLPQVQDESMEEASSVGDAMEEYNESLPDVPMPDVPETRLAALHIPDQHMPSPGLNFATDNDGSDETSDEEEILFYEEVDEAEVENQLYPDPSQLGNLPEDHTPGSPVAEQTLVQMIARSLAAINATLQRIEVAQNASKPKPQDDEDFADDEDDEPRKRSKKEKAKGNNGHQPRKPEHNHLHRAVRAHAVKLMKLQKDDPLPPAPSLQEIEWFEEGDSNVGPSLDDFVVDYLGAPTTAWNLAVTAIFVQDFIDTKWANVTSDPIKITAAWKSHMTYLRQKYRDSVRYEEDELAEVESKKTSARNARRLSLYYRRLQACKAHPALRKHTKMLRQLGASGMSSDDSGRERSPNAVYSVVKQSWRADAVKLWLRDMDGVHLSLRVTESGDIQHGHWPHQRRDSSRNFDHRPRNAVRGLPENFYNTRWLNGLGKHARMMLNEQEFHDLMHTDEIARIAYHWQGVTGPSNAPDV